jgi:hypothetical protein
VELYRGFATGPLLLIVPVVLVHEAMSEPPAGRGKDAAGLGAGLQVALVMESGIGGKVIDEVEPRGLAMDFEVDDAALAVTATGKVQGTPRPAWFSRLWHVWSGLSSAWPTARVYLQGRRAGKRRRAG